MQFRSMLSFQENLTILYALLVTEPICTELHDTGLKAYSILR